MLAALQHARDVHSRLRNPPNAVRDTGIDLKRNTGMKYEAVNSIQIKCTGLPRWPSLLDLGNPCPGYVLTYGPQLPAANPKPRVTIPDIQRAVARHFKVSRGDIIGPLRNEGIVYIRHIAIWLTRKITLRSLPEVGLKFGGRDHTTILHAARKIEAKRLIDPRLQATLDELVKAISPEMFESESVACVQPNEAQHEPSPA